MQYNHKLGQFRQFDSSWASWGSSYTSGIWEVGVSDWRDNYCFVCTMEGQVMKSLERSCYITVFANNDTPKKNHTSISFSLMTVTSGKSHLISDGKVQEKMSFHAAVEFQDVFQHESAAVSIL